VKELKKLVYLFRISPSLNRIDSTLINIE